MNFLLPILLFSVWTSAFSLSKYTLMVSTPLFLTAFRMLLAASILLFFLLIRKKEDLRIHKTHVIPLFVLAFLNIYMTNILESWGLQYLSSSCVCFINSLSPIFSSLFSYMHFKEKLTWKKSLGLSIGILAFFTAFITQTPNLDFSAFRFFSWPALAVVGSTLCSVYGWVLLRILVKKQDSNNIKSLSPIAANGYSMLLGGLFALMHSYAHDNWSFFPIAIGEGHHFLLGAVSLTLISNVLCYNFYGYLLKKFTATFLSFVGLLSPIFASFFGWVFLHESFSTPILMSTVLILFGMWLVYAEELKQGYIQKKNALKTSKSLS